jgi:hypothetical protein
MPGLYLKAQSFTMSSIMTTDLAPFTCILLASSNILTKLPTTFGQCLGIVCIAKAAN